MLPREVAALVARISNGPVVIVSSDTTADQRTRIGALAAQKTAPALILWSELGTKMPPAGTKSQADPLGLAKFLTWMDRGGGALAVAN